MTNILNVVGMDSVNGQFKIGQPNDSTLFPGNILFAGSVPTIGAGTGAGTGSTTSIAGVDNGGIITITTGTLPIGSATVATITFANSFPNGASIILYPGNSAAALLSLSGNIFAVIAASNFVIQSGTTALVGSTTYKWNYSVVGW